MVNSAIRTLADSATGGVKMRLEAWAIKRILDRTSREVVGWLYEWNTGEQEPIWKNGMRDDVVYE